MDLSRECHKACEAVQTFAAGVDNGPLPEGVEPLAIMLVELRQAADTIRQVQRRLNNEAHVRLADAGTVTLFDGTTIKRSQHWSRREVDREGLVNFIRDHPDVAGVDPVTGEMQAEPLAFSELLLKCFRQEPRWKQLVDLGLNDEEYCTKESIASVLVVPPESVESEDGGPESTW